MRCPSAFELVAGWEQGQQQAPLERALTLLATACPESRAELASLSIGARDARLVELYECVFGTRLDAFAECPACGERLEYSFTTGDLNRPPAVTSSAAELEAVEGTIRLRVRLPNSHDLLALSDCPDPVVASRRLAERCVVDATYEPDAISQRALSDKVVECAASRLQETDPASDQQIELRCSLCLYGWQVVFDIESFLWARVNALVKRLLTEVHVLASAYGWSEREVLAMGSARRQFYLEMV